MNTLERITAILEQARIAGGWVDEDVARVVLGELGLDENGEGSVAKGSGDTPASARAEAEGEPEPKPSE